MIGEVDVRRPEIAIKTNRTPQSRRKLMSRIPKLILALTAVILLSLAAPVVNADTIIVGAGANANKYPFGLGPTSNTGQEYTAGGTYQQVYSSSAFPGPITITQIAFASSAEATDGPGIATYNFTIGLSSTAAAPGGLSSNFAANRGADFLSVFSGPLVATITANNQFDLLIDITPFTYDPSNGNLLLDVVINSPTQFTGGSNLFFRSGFVLAATRAGNPSSGGTATFVDDQSLITRFTTGQPAGAVPEPATIFLLGSGLTSVAAGIRKRRKRSELR